jgi:hypothetical protein
VIVAEQTRGIGNGVSSRNSEVIHGGMYYPTGSRCTARAGGGCCTSSAPRMACRTESAAS